MNLILLPGVMDSKLASSMKVQGLDPPKIGICCFLAKHGTFRCKSKDLLAQRIMCLDKVACLPANFFSEVQSRIHSSSLIIMILSWICMKYLPFNIRQHLIMQSFNFFIQTSILLIKVVNLLLLLLFQVVCGRCSTKKVPLRYDNDHLNRVCDDCYLLLRNEEEEPVTPTNKKTDKKKDILQVSNSFWMI